MTCSGPPSPKAGSCSDSAGQLGPSGCSQGAKSEVHSPSLVSPDLCRSLPHLDSTSPLTPQSRLCPLLAPCHLTSLGHVVLNLPSPPRGPISPGPWRPPCHGPSGPVHLDALCSSLPGSTCWWWGPCPSAHHLWCLKPLWCPCRPAELTLSWPRTGSFLPQHSLCRQTLLLTTDATWSATPHAPDLRV